MREAGSTFDRIIVGGPLHNGPMQALDDPASAEYLARLAERARGLLGAPLIGTYVLNSGARDDYLPGRSDLDVAVVVDDALDDSTKHRLAAAVGHAALPCPAPRLELVVYRRSVVAAPGARPAFELNLNTGRTIADHLTTDPADEPSFWFVLDLAAASDASLSVFGPEGADVFG